MAEMKSAIWGVLASEHHVALSFKILCFYLVHGVITEDIVLEMKSAGLSLGYFFSFLSGKLEQVIFKLSF